MTITADDLCVEIHADGADKTDIHELTRRPRVRGFINTVTRDLVAKRTSLGRNLDEFFLDRVRAGDFRSAP